MCGRLPDHSPARSLARSAIGQSCSSRQERYRDVGCTAEWRRPTRVSLQVGREQMQVLFCGKCAHPEENRGAKSIGNEKHNNFIARYVANISHCFDVMERVAYVRKWAAPDADGRRICLARPCVCYRMSPVKYVHIGEGELRRRLITFPTLSRLSRLRISFHQCSGPVIFLLFFFSLRGPSIC